MYIPRQLTHRLLRLVDVFPVVVVTGARQVGKSTLLREVLGNDWQTVVLDPVLDVENARADPDLFLDNRRPPLVVDEIQYAPELVAAIKRRVDQDRSPGRYLLTGSQQWGALRAVAESLAGRAVFIDLEGFSFAEAASQPEATSWVHAWLDDPDGFPERSLSRLNRDRPVYETLWRGSLPEACLLPLDVLPDFHAAYRRTYVERDARLLAEVSDWQLFGRFLRLCAAHTAQEVNASHLGRDLGLTPQTARRWLDMLVATFQWYEVPALARNPVKRVSKRPKGYLADTGMACLAQAISSPEAIGAHPLQGALFETAVVAEVRKQLALRSPRPMLYHWRSHGGAEVDLVLELDATLYPLAIRATTRPRRRDTTGLGAFVRAHSGHRVAPGVVVCPVERAAKLSETVRAVPWDACSDRG